MPTKTKKELPVAEMLLSEVLQKVSNAKTKAEKIKPVSYTHLTLPTKA